MIIRKFIKNKGLVSLIAEDVDDLWYLKQLIVAGDTIIGETSRVIKRDSVYSRATKGERIKLKLTLRIEKTKLDSSFGRLRLFGKIIDVSDDIAPKGFHSIIITPNYRFWLKKDNWTKRDFQILKESERETVRFIVVALDRRDAGIGIIQGTHLQIFDNIESGVVGKYYNQQNVSFLSFFKKILEIIKSIFSNKIRIFIAGPGNIKNNFLNFINDQNPVLAKNSQLIEGIDIAGEDGIRMTLRSPQLIRYIQDSKLARITSLVNQFIKRIADGDDRIAFTFNEVKKLSKIGAIDSVLISDKIFEFKIDEDQIVDLLNTVETFHGKGYLIDSSTDTGSQIMQMGGIIALLRFSTKTEGID